MTSGEPRDCERHDIDPLGEPCSPRSWSSPRASPVRASTLQTLTTDQTKALENFHSRKALQYSQKHVDGSHGHDHGSSRPSICTALISGMINWLLMFGLCCAYGMIIFSDDWHLQHVTLGVKMNLSTAFFVGLAVALLSKVRVAIAGPDLNPVVFLAEFVAVIGKSIAEELAMEYPDHMHRRLAGDGGGPTFCMGDHLQAHEAECLEYHEQLRATVIFATSVSSAVLGLIFFCIGFSKLTRFMSYVPLCIMEAFLSCVGYKVFKYALKFCKYDPVQFIPAACLGVLMYFIKAMHIGNPAVSMPLGLAVPLGAFYVIVFASGSNLEKARGDDYMFPEIHDIDFWMVWTKSLGNVDKINMKAWMKTLPDLAIMVVVCALDCLLKIVGTEGKLSMRVDKDYEIQLYGLSNFLTVASGSSVGYMQLKFNVINFGIMGNKVDRRSGIVYAVLCGTAYFGTIKFFNFQPRFFLGMLLFFAGSGFVIENLWGSRRYLTRREWLQVFAILAVFIFSEKLLYAVIVGAMLTCIDFVDTYAKIPCLLDRPMRGGEITTHERYNPVLHKNLQHIANSWLLVLRLKGYIFFGSAQSIVGYLRGEIESQKHVPAFRRLRYVVFDCKFLDGMDASAAKGIKKVEDEATGIGVQFLWSHVSPRFAQELKMRDIVVDDSEWFANLNEAVLFVEAESLEFLRNVQQAWVRLHPALKLYHELMQAQDEYDPFQNVLMMDSMRHGCPWKYCETIRLEQHKTLLWEPGQTGVPLYLIHSGAVGLYKRLPSSDDPGMWLTPTSVYRHGWFLNREARAQARTQYYAVALEEGFAICWSERQWFKMSHQQPHMALAISTAVARQHLYDSEIAERQPDHIVSADGPAELDLILGLVSDKSGTDIPDELQNRFDDLHTAQVLENYGLFECPDVHGNDQHPFAVVKPTLPSLPAHFADDLEAAFQAYSQISVFQEKATSVEEKHIVLPGEKVVDALLYVGISNVVLEDIDAKEYSLPDFLKIGWRAIMARLNKPQLDSIQRVFLHYDADGSGELDRSELDVVLKETFHPLISMEEIDGLAVFWDEDGSGKIGDAEFCRLVSRFIRQHEQEWSLLCALRELAGEGPEADPAQHMLTVGTLVRNTQGLLSEEEAEEMLWAADWRSGGRGGGTELLLRDVLPALMLDVDEHVGSLPPPCLERKPEARTARWSSALAAVSESLLLEKTAHLGSSATTGAVARDPGRSVADFRDASVRDRILARTCSDDPCAERTRGTRRNILNLDVDGQRACDPEKHDPKVDASPGTRLRKPFWVRMDLVLNNPRSSPVAKAWFTVIVVSVSASLLVLVMEPLLSPVSSGVWLGFEVYFTALFSLDLVLRLCVAFAQGRPAVQEFVTDMVNICDFVAVLPLYLELIWTSGIDEFQILRINRLVRVFRVFRLMRDLNMMQMGAAAGANIMVLAVIWGIYLKNREDPH